MKKEAKTLFLCSIFHFVTIIISFFVSNMLRICVCNPKEKESLFSFLCLHSRFHFFFTYALFFSFFSYKYQEEEKKKLQKW
ncbi:hypothetical protein STCU_10924 [Strigomonas culicis]|uniref:Uncharacterized protein n=1 Tax=Strigomonas culicis TaxID=28005 RepID=S9TKN1_9TRYP|nr:hypothetical protein STCU_10924 [Strigomonas culicis]|eukprot:EPY16888.1 hypothetical protein STCU_10924 [Strigomonas culicis]